MICACGASLFLPVDRERKVQQSRTQSATMYCYYTVHCIKYAESGRRTQCVYKPFDFRFVCVQNIEQYCSKVNDRPTQTILWIGASFKSHTCIVFKRTLTHSHALSHAHTNTHTGTHGKYLFTLNTRVCVSTQHIGVYECSVKLTTVIVSTSTASQPARKTLRCTQPKYSNICISMKMKDRERRA